VPGKWQFVVDRLKRGASLEPKTGIALVFGFRSLEEAERALDHPSVQMGNGSVLDIIGFLEAQNRPVDHSTAGRQSAFRKALQQWAEEEPEQTRKTLRGYAEWVHGAGYDVPWKELLEPRIPGCSLEKDDGRNLTYRQEQAILDAIAELKLDPLRLNRPRGKSGSKADVRNKLMPGGKNCRLFRSYGVFDKTWERLRRDGRIADEGTPP
jgi:hypothetical protein